jgi:hydroxyacylglutathione hydrolase
MSCHEKGEGACPSSQKEDATPLTVAMPLPSWLHFFQRPFPSANMLLLEGARPLLVDTGFGSDADETEHLVRAAGIPPQRLALIVNTHYHSDHVGGNHHLQTRYGVPIAAHRWDAAMINHHDPEAWSARWLDQPIAPYRVDRALAEGDELDVGGVTLQVLHTSGHTLGHLALYEPTEQILIAGDTVHVDDLAWIGYFREGAGALERAMETIERLMRLKVRAAFSGHGPAHKDFQHAAQRALRRYEQWVHAPEKMAWHACKRIFAYRLMLVNGLSEADVTPYLLRCQWFLDYSRVMFRQEPQAFIQPFLEEMLRSGAAAWREGRLVALAPQAPHRPPSATWLAEQLPPGHWPPQDAH